MVPEDVSQFEANFGLLKVGVFKFESQESNFKNMYSIKTYQTLMKLVKDLPVQWKD